MIWVLISLAEISLAVVYYYLTPLGRNNELGEYKKQKVVDAEDNLTFLDSVLVAVSYWIFAVEYLRLALKFPLILGQLPEEKVKSIKRRNLGILIGLNLFFYSGVTYETYLWLKYGYRKN